MKSSVWRVVDAILLCGLLGCSSPSAANDGPPVPDPGGPFSSSVPSARRIDSLTLVESDVLCREIANAYYAFLQGAIETANVCGETATTVSSEQFQQSDGGVDASALCTMAYERCAGSQPTAAPFFCPVPAPGSGSQACDATVEDLSACLNETAALDPVGMCRTSPGCPGDASVYTDARSRPATPACDRLRRICPVLDSVATFPC